jgi:hypothetical protein
VAAHAKLEAVSSFHMAGKLERCLALLDEIEKAGNRVPAGVARAIPMERAAALFGLGRAEEGVAVYRAEMERWGDRVPGRQVRLVLAVKLIDLGRDDEARALCENLWPRIRLEPEGVEAGRLLADLLERAGDRAGARAILASIVKVGDPERAAEARARLERLELSGRTMPALPAGALIEGPESTAGRRLAVVFWDPARDDSARALLHWQRTLADSKTVVVSVVLGADEERARAGIARYGVTVPTRLGRRETVEAWRVTDVPTAFVVGPDGRIEATAWPTGAASRLR